MEIDIALGEGSTDASSLRRWLMAEPELRSHAVVSVKPAAQEQGLMGGALDVVNVVLSNSIALGSLITAVAAWRGSRPRAPQITLERDGSVVTLYDSSPELVDRILREWNGTPGLDPSAADGGGE